MSNYLLQSAVSASGHVNNWTSLPGFIVGYHDISSKIIPVAYPFGNQCIDKSFCGFFASYAKTGSAPMSSVNCDIVPNIGNQTPPVSTYGNWRIRRKRRRKRTRQDKDTVPAKSGDNFIARYENTALQVKEASKADNFSVENVELDASREERNNHLKSLEETRYCRVCRATFNAPAQAKQHYVGRLHTRMVRTIGLEGSERGFNLLASTVSSSSSSPSLGSSAPSSVSPSPAEAPLAGDQQVKLFSDAYSSSSMTHHRSSSVTCPGSGSRISASVYCAVCSVAFNSDKQAIQHYAGKTHAKRLRAEDVIYTYTKNGYVTRRCQEKPTLRQTKGQRLLPAEGFVCFVCGAQMTSQCRMKRHLRNRHRLYRIPLEFASFY